MVKSDDFAARLERAMKDAGTDASALAAHLGVSYQAVKKVFAGTTKALTAENTVKAAKFLGVDSEWLATGEGSSTPGASGLSPLAILIAKVADEYSSDEQRETLLRLARTLAPSQVQSGELSTSQRKHKPLARDAA